MGQRAQLDTLFSGLYGSQDGVQVNYEQFVESIYEEFAENIVPTNAEATVSSDNGDTHGPKVERIEYNDEVEALAEDEEEGLSEDSDEEERRKLATRAKGRRRSFANPSVAEHQINDYTKPAYPKDEASTNHIRDTLTNHEKMQVLIGHLAQSAVTDIVNAFYAKDFAEGVNIINQGEPGECLYIIADGCVDIFVARPGADAQIAPGEKGFKVATWESGALFGELALMYDAPRAATVTAASAVSAWVLDAQDFKMLLLKAAKATYAKYEGWLSQVDLLKTLNHFELAHLADIMESDCFDDGEDIITQGDEGDRFYILEDGTAAAYIHGDDGEKEVKTYEAQGDYFGEVALLTSQPRLATVRATGEGCVVASIGRDDFVALLGPISDMLEGHIDEYPRYAAFLQ